MNTGAKFSAAQFEGLLLVCSILRRKEKFLYEVSENNFGQCDTAGHMLWVMLVGYTWPFGPCGTCRTKVRWGARRVGDDREQRWVALYSLVVVWPSPLVGLGWTGLSRVEMRSRASLEKEEWEAPDRGARVERATQSAK